MQAVNGKVNRRFHPLPSDPALHSGLALDEVSGYTYEVHSKVL